MGGREGERDGEFFIISKSLLEAIFFYILPWRTWELPGSCPHITHLLLSTSVNIFQMQLSKWVKTPEII